MPCSDMFCRDLYESQGNGRCIVYASMIFEEIYVYCDMYDYIISYNFHWSIHISITNLVVCSIITFSMLPALLRELLYWLSSYICAKLIDKLPHFSSGPFVLLFMRFFYCLTISLVLSACVDYKSSDEKYLGQPVRVHAFYFNTRNLMHERSEIVVLVVMCFVY